MRGLTFSSYTELFVESRQF